MEVLLLQDIDGIGKKNDLLIVGDGYALNFLLPKRAALVATPLVRRHYADHIRKRAEEREKERQHQSGVAAQLSGKTLQFHRKATKTGKLYAALHEALIAEALKEQHQLTVSEENIEIPTAIKALGTYQVNVTLAGQTLPVTVKVEAEKVGAKAV